MEEVVFQTRTYMAPIGHSYDIFIDDEIADPPSYRDEFSIIYGATPSDIINIYINSDGGDLATTCQFMNAMHSCEAQVNTHLVYAAASGASMILLRGDNIIIHPNSYIMCHNASGGYGGKISDIHSYAVHAKDSLANIMRSTYYGFLTENEIESMLKGEEYWMQYEEINERLQKRIDLFNSLPQDGEESVED